MSYISFLDGAINSSVTNIDVVGTNGLMQFRGDYYLCLDDEAGTQEYVYVHGKVGKTLSVSRGQLGSSAVSWSDGAVIKSVAPGEITPGTGATLIYDINSNTTSLDISGSSGLTHAEVVTRAMMRF